MGWTEGSELAESIWLLVRPYIPEGETRACIARQIISEFESYDCDTMEDADTLRIDANDQIRDHEK